MRVALPDVSSQIYKSVQQSTRVGLRSWQICLMLLLLYIPIKVWDIRGGCLSATAQARVRHPKEKETGRQSTGTGMCYSAYHPLCMRTATPLSTAVTR